MGYSSLDPDVYVCIGVRCSLVLVFVIVVVVRLLACVRSSLLSSPPLLLPLS